MVIDQTRKGGFRLRTIDEIAVSKEKKADVESISDGERKPSSDLDDKKGEEEFVEVVR